MMGDIFYQVEQRGHEQVVVFNYPNVGLKAIVAIHNTALGPALGGCRIRQYPDDVKALDDALRLSEGMSYKSALAGMPLGGGKACIYGDPLMVEGRTELLLQFGRCVQFLCGRYVTAEDMGISVEDIALIRTVTPYAVGRPPSEAGGAGDPSPWTARGVFLAMQTACAHKYGSESLTGKRVLVQGIGHVGAYLVEHLVQAGAKVTITDARPERIEAIKAKYNVAAASLDELYDVPGDIFSPCAVGQTVNKETVRRLTTQIICGAANNQIAEPTIYGDLEAKKILYCPDFVVNAAGVISAGAELNEGGWKESWVAEKVSAIPKTLKKIIQESEKRQKFPEIVALELAREIIEDASKCRK